MQSQGSDGLLQFAAKTLFLEYGKDKEANARRSPSLMRSENTFTEP
jgi:hypothetical protein